MRLKIDFKDKNFKF